VKLDEGERPLERTGLSPHLLKQLVEFFQTTCCILSSKNYRQAIKHLRRPLEGSGLSF
jgi:hypothetical protein